MYKFLNKVRNIYMDFEKLIKSKPINYAKIYLLVDKIDENIINQQKNKYSLEKNID